MIDGLRKGIGHSIVVDYKTNSGKIVYAKGILKDVIAEPAMLLIEGKDGTLWYVAFSSIESLKIDGDGDEGDSP